MIICQFLVLNSELFKNFDSKLIERSIKDLVSILSYVNHDYHLECVHIFINIFSDQIIQFELFDSNHSSCS